MLHTAIAVMLMDEELCPVQAAFLGLKAIVQVPNAFTQLIKDARGLQRWRSDFVVFGMPGHKFSVGVESLVNKEKLAVDFVVVIRWAVTLSRRFVGYINS
jgi:hypothetical protein